KRSVGLHRERTEFVLFQRPPVRRLILRAPDDVFAYAGPSVRGELLTHVERHAAGCDLDDQLRSTVQIAFGIDPRLAAILGRDAQKTIGLWDIVGAEAGG